jgi:N-carbamoyl-L-amino-acid hydrolase
MSDSGKGMLSPVFDVVDRELAAGLFDRVRTLSQARAGVTRPAYSETETAVLEIMAEAARGFGLATNFDPAANLVAADPEAPDGAPAVWLGSHVDSVAEGGNFDGLAGVIAGLLCAGKAKSSGAKLERPLRFVALRAEEAVWFGKTYLGSYSLFGQLSPADLERKHRLTGHTLHEHMRGVGADVDRIARGEKLISPQDAVAWLELHIEQAPLMVDRGVPVGVVTGIRGSMRHQAIRCLGVAGHSGAVPRSLRHDAVLATAHLITRLDAHWGRFEAEGADLVFTNGVFWTDPQEHAATRIPGELTFSLDIRSKSLDNVERFYTVFQEEAAAIEKERGVRFQLDDRVIVQPGIVDEGWASRFRESATALGYPWMDILSGAGHDAAVFANNGVPAAMVFVRNEGGSHNPDERMDIDDFMKGAEVLYAAATGRVS